MELELFLQVLFVLLRLSPTTLSPSFSFSPWNGTHISHLSHAIYISCLSQPLWFNHATNVYWMLLSESEGQLRGLTYDMRNRVSIGLVCSLCRLIGQTLWYLSANWGSFIRWSYEQWVSQCCAIECSGSFYCALFCVFTHMTLVSQCPISLRSELAIEMQRRFRVEL
jgi:hypothetical protein